MTYYKIISLCIYLACLTCRLCVSRKISNNSYAVIMDNVLKRIYLPRHRGVKMKYHVVGVSARPIQITIKNV